MTLQLRVLFIFSTLALYSAAVHASDEACKVILEKAGDVVRGLTSEIKENRRIVDINRGRGWKSLFGVSYQDTRNLNELEKLEGSIRHDESVRSELEQIKVVINNLQKIKDAESQEYLDRLIELEKMLDNTFMFQ